MKYLDSQLCPICGDAFQINTKHCENCWSGGHNADISTMQQWVLKNVPKGFKALNYFDQKRLLSNINKINLGNSYMHIGKPIAGNDKVVAITIIYIQE